MRIGFVKSVEQIFQSLIRVVAKQNIAAAAEMKLSLVFN